MNKYELVKKIEDFAPPDTAESWDCSGWLVDSQSANVEKVMLALTVTQDVVEQARAKGCDMIISHHPLFEVPLSFKAVDIYCAHTNLDKAQGGTTDEILRVLGFESCKIVEEFLRVVGVEIEVLTLLKKLKKISPNVRYVNNFGKTNLKKIGFCAGSGGDFIEVATTNGLDALVTGDLKFHQALDSKIVLFDIGHFESEILVLNVLKELISNEVEMIFANERSPFIKINC